PIHLSIYGKRCVNESGWIIATSHENSVQVHIRKENFAGMFVSNLCESICRRRVGRIMKIPDPASFIEDVGLPQNCFVPRRESCERAVPHDQVVVFNQSKELPLSLIPLPFS